MSVFIGSNDARILAHPPSGEQEMTDGGAGRGGCFVVNSDRPCGSPKIQTRSPRLRTCLSITFSASH